MNNSSSTLWRSQLYSTPENVRLHNKIVSAWGERSLILGPWRIDRTIPVNLEGSLFMIIEIDGTDIGIELESLPMPEEMPPMLTRKEIIDSGWNRLSSEIALAPLWDALQEISGGKVHVSMSSHLDGLVEAIGVRLTHTSTHQSILGKLWVTEKSWKRLSKHIPSHRPNSSWNLQKIPLILRWIWGKVPLTYEELLSLEIGDALAIKPISERHHLDLYTNNRLWAGGISESNLWSCNFISNINSIQERIMPHLKNIQVTVTFEVGRFSLTLEELEKLQIGSTLPCPSVSPSHPLIMRVNGTEVGRGEIIEVGDQLAVRLTERNIQFSSVSESSTGDSSEFHESNADSEGDSFEQDSDDHDSTDSNFFDSSEQDDSSTEESLKLKRNHAL